MKLFRLTAVLPLALLSLGSAAVSTAVAPPAVSPSCVLAGTGMVDNIWRNGDGSWSDPSHWSRGVVPGTTSFDAAEARTRSSDPTGIACGMPLAATGLASNPTST